MEVRPRQKVVEVYVINSSSVVYNIQKPTRLRFTQAISPSVKCHLSARRSSTLALFPVASLLSQRPGHARASHAMLSCARPLDESFHDASHFIPREVRQVG